VDPPSKSNFYLIKLPHTDAAGILQGGGSAFPHLSLSGRPGKHSAQAYTEVGWAPPAVCITIVSTRYKIQHGVRPNLDGYLVAWPYAAIAGRIIRLRLDFSI
jgi:hypothetical protein